MAIVTKMVGKFVRSENSPNNLKIYLHEIVYCLLWYFYVVLASTQKKTGRITVFNLKRKKARDVYVVLCTEWRIAISSCLNSSKLNLGL